jgi:hypothetical protein
MELLLKARRGPMKAVVAVAASMLTAAYYILKRNLPYRDLTAAYFDSRDRTKLANRLIRRLHDLGIRVEIATALPAPLLATSLLSEGEA